MWKALFIFVVSVWLVTYGEKIDDTGKTEKDALREIMTQCNETFVTEMPYVVALFKNGSFPDETNKNPKCYVKCLLDKTGVMNEKGDIDTEVLIKMFGPDNTDKDGKEIDVEKITKDCAIERREQCKCEKAYNFLKCVIQKSMENSTM